MDDLDTAAIEEFRKRWINKSGNQGLTTLSREQLLNDAEALVDGSLTYAALILFGTRKALGRHLAQAEVIFEYRSSDASGPAQQRKEFRQGFFSFYDELWKLITGGRRYAFSWQSAIHQYADCHENVQIRCPVINYDKRGVFFGIHGLVGNTRTLPIYYPNHILQISTEARMPAASAQRAAGRAWRVRLMPTLPK